MMSVPYRMGDIGKMKRVFKKIREIIKKLQFRWKLKEMDEFAAYTDMSSWMLFPPSFYYTHTDEEIEQATAEAKARIYKMLEELDKKQPCQ